MQDIPQEYKQHLDRLRKLIRSPKAFDEAIASAIDLHALTHTGAVSGSEAPTFCDQLLEGLADADYSVMPTGGAIPLWGSFCSR